MPWRDKAKAIIQAWYQGQSGPTAIAEIITGKVDPSGRLPMTWYASVEQTAHPVLVGAEFAPKAQESIVDYNEGAEIGYRWMAKTGQTPLYSFGHGLSYTNFTYSDLKVAGGKTVTASFTVTNSGSRAGADVPQLYMTGAASERRMRLLGFERIELQPGQSHRVTLIADPRLLARYDVQAGRWRITKGVYQIALGKSAGDLLLTAQAQLSAQLFGH